ncbi:hypothetical protein EIP86_007546 [Pleurotus ostreatoroseus]|nr:hypothetical protein EIP86_007546 [Pleurotus ostreatoroseus]
MSNDPYAFGVPYTPAGIASDNQETVDDRPRFSLSEIEQLGVRWIRVVWLDYTNVPRFRILSRVFFTRLLKSTRPGIPVAKVTFGLVHLNLTEGLTSAGEYLYVFDTNSFRILPYATGHASIMGFFQLKVPPPTLGLNPISLCPRGMLQRIVKDARDRAGVLFLVGFESEFVLLKSTDPIVTINNADYSTSAKLPGGAIESVVLEEISESLLSAGVEVQQYHGEGGRGQYEVVTGPLAPLEAADALVYTRETIYNIANKHGLRATFAPKLSSRYGGNGSHTHISVHNAAASSANGGSLRSDVARAPTLAPTERSFLQGLLTHLPALCAITLPTPHSYNRVHDGVWAGGTYAVWGTDNREAAVRLAGSRGLHHFEVRCVDATANPYLVLAGLLVAGAQGILDRSELRTGDCGKAVVLMEDTERIALGVETASRLPRSVEEARKCLLADLVLKETLGDEFMDAYLKVNKLLGDNLVLEDEHATISKLVNFY